MISRSQAGRAGQPPYYPYLAFRLSRPLLVRTTQSTLSSAERVAQRACPLLAACSTSPGLVPAWEDW